ncbi:MAG: hypothetical protein AB8B65_20225 [Kordia sp.]|uniref:hypothetical protein n=1 Tax=Kordia sp. TaxID=1965332 RepID=UPI00385F2945
MNIELTPLIELPTFKFPDLEGMTDIEKKYQLLIERNYSEVKNLKPFNQHQYRLTDLSLFDLKKAIDLHISDIPISDSCAFFGGYGLKINDEFVLFPQCCGLLSEINDWKKILNENFEPFHLSECHPAPRFEKIGNNVIIECDSSHEVFHPKAQNQIVVNYTSLTHAIHKVSIRLNKISKILDEFNSEYKTESIAKYLIWGE